MDTIKEEAYEILDIAKNIYQIQERINPNVIIKDKVFIMGTEDDPNAVSVKRDYEKNYNSYYFETSEIHGVILLKKNGNYCIKARTKYINDNNQNLWFAKIRIEISYDGDIQIMGKWGGSWQDNDFYDEDLIKKPNSDFPAALTSMRNHLTEIYNQLGENSELNSDLYNPEWVRKIKKYNN